MSAVSLSGVSDLVEAYKQGLGDSAVVNLIGGSPEKYPERYQAASPVELLPTGTRQVLVHGTKDSIVPISQSENFVAKAEHFGELTSLAKLEGVGHFEVIDPDSDVWPVVEGVVLQVLGV